MTGFYVDSRSCGKGLQAINDGLGTVGDRKNSIVRFYFEFDTAVRKPLQRVAGHEPIKRSEQLSTSARIKLNEFVWRKTGVRYVASTAAGDAHFTKRVGSFFVQNDLTIRIGFCCGNSGKVARCMTATVRCVTMMLSYAENNGATLIQVAPILLNNQPMQPVVAAVLLTLD
jgi:hypothetical protein